MNLVYLWIGNYKSIQNQGILLTSKYEVVNDGRVKFVEVKSRFSELYFPIKKITSLIGRNGSGKSSVLEVIILLLNGDFYNVDAVLVVEENGELKIIGDDEKRLFDKNIKRLDYESNLVNMQAIYYSPVFSPHNQELGKEYFPDKKVTAFSQKKHSLIARRTVVNVSNNFLYADGVKPSQKIDLKDQFNFLESSEEFSGEKLGFQKYFIASFRPIKLKLVGTRFINLLLKSSRLSVTDESNLFFKIISDAKLFPEEVMRHVFKVSEKYENNSNIDASADDLKYISGYFDFLQNEYDEIIESLSLEEQIENYFIYYVLERQLARPDSDMYTIIIILLFISMQNKRDFHLLRNKIIRKNYNFPREIIEKLNESIDAACKDAKSLSAFIIKNKLGKKFPLKFNTQNSEDALKLVHELQKGKYSKYSIDVSWDGVSSGQLAKLNLYSRLYRGIKEIEKSNNKKEERLIILLDEADIYLHPEWQRVFLSELKDFFKEIFKGYSIELILTSHSPIMISDLAKQDVYIMEKNLNNHYSTITQSKHETFASNLHTMYQKGFHLENTTGQLAHEYIEKLFKEIEGGASPSDKQVNAWLECVSGIGEPIVKLGLENLIKSKKSSKAELIKYYLMQVDSLSKAEND